MIAIFGASGYIGSKLISFLNKKKLSTFAQNYQIKKVL